MVGRPRLVGVGRHIDTLFRNGRDHGLLSTEVTALVRSHATPSQEGRRPTPSLPLAPPLSDGVAAWWSDPIVYSPRLIDAPSAAHQLSYLVANAPCLDPFLCFPPSHLISVPVSIPFAPSSPSPHPPSPLRLAFSFFQGSVLTAYTLWLVPRIVLSLTHHHHLLLSHHHVVVGLIPLALRSPRRLCLLHRLGQR